MKIAMMRSPWLDNPNRVKAATSYVLANIYPCWDGPGSSGGDAAKARALKLKFFPQDAQSLQTGVGAKVAAPLKRGPVTAVPLVYATCQHEYSNSTRVLYTRLIQGGTTFASQTDNPCRNFAVAGPNVTILTQKNLQVQIDCNAEVGRGNYAAHDVNADCGMNF